MAGCGRVDFGLAGGPQAGDAQAGGDGSGSGTITWHGTTTAFIALPMEPDLVEYALAYVLALAPSDHFASCCISVRSSPCG